MGRSPASGSYQDGLNKGTWSASEDKLLTDFVKLRGEGKWSSLARDAGLKRCGKSCRLRWMNYLRPDIKRGNISPDEEELIIRLHKLLGNRWALIAGRLPGRTDNEIKNYWNTNISKSRRGQDLDLAHIKYLTKQPRSEPAQEALQCNNNSEGGGDENDNDNDSNTKVAISEKLFGEESRNKNSAGEESSNTASPTASNSMQMEFSAEDICNILDLEFTKLNGHDDRDDIMILNGMIDQDHHVDPLALLASDDLIMMTSDDQQPPDDDRDHDQDLHLQFGSNFLDSVADEHDNQDGDWLGDHDLANFFSD